MKMKTIYGVEVPDCYRTNDKNAKYYRDSEEYRFENDNLKTIDANIEYTKQFLKKKVVKDKKKINIREDEEIDISKLAQDNKIPLDKIAVSIEYEKEYGYYNSVDVILKLTIAELSYEDNLVEIEQLKFWEQYKKDWLLCQPYFEKVQAARNNISKKKELKEMQAKINRLKKELE